MGVDHMSAAFVRTRGGEGAIPQLDDPRQPVGQVRVPDAYPPGRSSSHEHVSTGVDPVAPGTSPLEDRCGSLHRPPFNEAGRVEASAGADVEEAAGRGAVGLTAREHVADVRVNRRGRKRAAIQP
jgi:hypothetical protein